MHNFFTDYFFLKFLPRNNQIYIPSSLLFLTTDNNTKIQFKAHLIHQSVFPVLLLCQVPRNAGIKGPGKVEDGKAETKVKEDFCAEGSRALARWKAWRGLRRSAVRCQVLLGFVILIPAGVPRSEERRYQGPRSRKWQSGRWKIVWNCQELEFCAHLYHTTVYLVFSSLGIYVCGFTMFCPHLLCTTEHLPNFILVLNSKICRR